MIFTCTPSSAPDDAGWYARWDNELYISNTQDRDDGERDDATPELLVAADFLEESGFDTAAKFMRRRHLTGGYVTPDKAEQWVRDGRAQYREQHWVTHPDWHTHSWLTAAEYREALRRCQVWCEYKVLGTILDSFEEQGFDARVVFWFDN